MYDQPASSGRNGYLIAELPDRERPRERLLHHGVGALSDTELLAILLRSGSRGRSVLELAREVLHNYEGNLNRLASATIGELRRIRGIGPAKAVELRAAFALAARLSAFAAGTRPRIESPLDVVGLLRETFRTSNQEEFHVLLLDTKRFLLRCIRVTMGLVDRTQVHAREVFRDAIRESSSCIILAHNHPSGDPTPSAQDISSTRELVAAGQIVGISVLDHVIIGKSTPARPSEYISMREERLLRSEGEGSGQNPARSG